MAVQLTPETLFKNDAERNVVNDFLLQESGKKSRPPLSHMRQLDGLRALAVVLVVVSHTINLTDASPVELGSAGVRLFFVLSGFLITGILLRARAEAEQSGRGLWFVVRMFYARRFLRIFPLYYLTLSLATVAGLPGVRADLPWHAAYLTNALMVVTKETPLTGGHFWSLAVEEQFYLMWPFLVLFTPRRWLWTVIASAVLAGPVARYLGYHLLYTSMTRFLMPCCLDSLGMGALLSLVREGCRKAEAPLAWGCLTLGALLLAIQCTLSLPRDASLVVNDFTLALLFTWLVRAASIGISGPGRLLGWRPVAYIGTISYGIYVWHLFVPEYTALSNVTLPGKGPCLFAFVLPLTVAVSVLSWQLFEKPLNELKKYFPYNPPSSQERNGDAVAL